MAAVGKRLPAAFVSSLVYSNTYRLPILRGKIFYKQRHITSFLSRWYCTEERVAQPTTVSQVENEHIATKKHEETFEEMLQNSSLVKMGRPQGKRVFGKIIYVNRNDLYVDFGWKFHGVVQKPEVTQYTVAKERDFKEGSWVEVEINELEQTGHFLGQHRRLTLCEADIKLIYQKSQIPEKSPELRKPFREEKQEKVDDLTELILS